MADGTQSKCRAVCLISGSGTNLQAIIENINNKSLNIDLISVISDNPMAKGIQRAEKEGIDTKIIDYSTFEDRKEFDKSVEIQNIHPSLLPKYKGLNTHQKVIDNNEKYHGASVHFVVPELDDGPVIIQYQCEVDKNDDHHSLQKKVLQGEYIIYSKALQWFSENRLVFDSGNIFLDGEALLKPRLIRKD